VTESLPGLGRYASAGATFDAMRVYRYRLWRIWRAPATRVVLWVMLNPSTADERELDPTLRRCEGFTRAWDFDGFEVVNLFPLRATDPAELARHCRPEGEPGVNDATILAAAARATRIVVGWGGEPFASDRARAVAQLLADFDLFCLGPNAGHNVDGSPKHPLYLAARSPLWKWKVPA
jgi:hypothetical protein